MKKIVYLLLSIAYLLNGCRSNTTPSDTTKPALATDTAKTKISAPTPPPIDTSIKDGPVIRRFANGVIKERSNYVNGRRQGECQSFYPTGKLQSDDFFQAGLLNGSTLTYYENGEKRYEGTYTQGKPSGVWKFYDDKGKLLHSKDYGTAQNSNNPAM